MNRGWSTKEDILKDLAVATGKKLHIDNSYLVVGERPPPRHISEPDDEMELMFRDAIGEKPVDMVIAPDLRGITEMIRMVQDYDDTSSDCDKKVCSTRPKSPCNVISISKLNPNVKEFKPRGKSHSTDVQNKPEGQESPGEKKTGNEKHLTKTTNHDNEKGQSVNNLKQNVVEKQKDVNSNDILKAASSPDKSTHETKSVTDELRNKIQQPNHGGLTTFQVKKERNVAIANLQKLLSVQPNGASAKNLTEETVKPMKLLTPDYYERSKADVLNEDIETKCKILREDKIVDDMTSNESNCTSNKPSGSSYQLIKKMLHSKLSKDKKTASDPGIPNNASYLKVDTNALSTASENKMGDKETNEKVFSDSDLSDPQVRDSINKVNNWLNENDGKTNKKQPASQISSPTPPLLSAFTFKRKQTSKSPIVPETKVLKPAQNTIQQYKPSEYANELNKMYMERLNKIKKTKEKNGWANLEELLKEKDEKIKQEKLKAKSSTASDSQ